MNALKALVRGGLCYGLYLVSIIASCAAALFGPERLMPEGLFGRFFAMSLIGAAAFMLLYACLALGVVSIYERRRNFEFGKPSLIWGLLISTCAPVMLWLLSVLMFLRVLTTGGLHDSM